MDIFLKCILIFGVLHKCLAQTGTIPDGPTIDITRSNPQDIQTFSSGSLTSSGGSGAAASGSKGRSISSGFPTTSSSSASSSGVGGIGDQQFRTGQSGSLVSPTGQSTFESRGSGGDIASQRGTGSRTFDQSTLSRGRDQALRFGQADGTLGGQFRTTRDKQLGTTTRRRPSQRRPIRRFSSGGNRQQRRRFIPQDRQPSSSLRRRLGATQDPLIDRRIDRGTGSQGVIRRRRPMTQDLTRRVPQRRMTTSGSSRISRRPIGSQDSFGRRVSRDPSTQIPRRTTVLPRDTTFSGQGRSAVSSRRFRDRDFGQRPSTITRSRGTSSTIPRQTTRFRDRPRTSVRPTQSTRMMDRVTTGPQIDFRDDMLGSEPFRSIGNWDGTATDRRPRPRMGPPYEMTTRAVSNRLPIGRRSTALRRRQPLRDNRSSDIGLRSRRVGREIPSADFVRDVVPREFTRSDFVNDNRFVTQDLRGQRFIDDNRGAITRDTTPTDFVNDVTIVPNQGTAPAVGTRTTDFINIKDDTISPTQDTFDVVTGQDDQGRIDVVTQPTMPVQITEVTAATEVRPGNDETVNVAPVTVQDDRTRLRPIETRPAPTAPPVVLPPIRARGDMRFQLPEATVSPRRRGTDPPVMRVDMPFEMPTIPITSTQQMVTTTGVSPTTVPTTNIPTTDPGPATTVGFSGTTASMPDTTTTDFVTNPTTVPTTMPPEVSTIYNPTDATTNVQQTTSNLTPLTTDSLTTMLPTIFPTKPWTPDVSSTVGTTADYFTYPQSTTPSKTTTTEGDDSKEASAGPQNPTGTPGPGTPTMTSPSTSSDDSREASPGGPTMTPAGPGSPTTTQDDSSEVSPGGPNMTPAGPGSPTTSQDDSSEASPGGPTMTPAGPGLPKTTQDDSREVSPGGPNTGFPTTNGNTFSPSPTPEIMPTSPSKSPPGGDNSSGSGESDSSGSDGSKEGSSESTDSDDEDDESSSDESDSESGDSSGESGNKDGSKSDGSSSEASSSSDDDDKSGSSETAESSGSSESGTSGSSESGERKRKGRRGNKKKDKGRNRNNNNNNNSNNDSLFNDNVFFGGFNAKDLGWDSWLGNGNPKANEWWNTVGSGEVGAPLMKGIQVRPDTNNDDDEMVPIEETKALLDDIERDVDEMYYNTRSWLHVINEAGPLTKRAMNKLHRFDNLIGMTYRRMSEEFFKMPLFTDLNNNNNNNNMNNVFGLNMNLNEPNIPQSISTNRPTSFIVQNPANDDMGYLVTNGLPPTVQSGASPVTVGPSLGPLDLPNTMKDDSGEKLGTQGQPTTVTIPPLQGINIIDTLNSANTQSNSLMPSDMNINSLNGQLTSGQNVGNHATVKPGIGQIDSGDR